MVYIPKINKGFSSNTMLSNLQYMLHNNRT